MSEHKIHIWSSMTGYQAACTCKWTGDEHHTKDVAATEGDRHIAATKPALVPTFKKLTDEHGNVGHVKTVALEIPHTQHRDSTLTRDELEAVRIALELYSERELSRERQVATFDALVKVTAMLAALETGK